MRLIIDTYNVLHTVGVLPEDLAGIDLPGLIALIRRSRYRAQRVDLVCDGTGPRPDPGVGVPGVSPGAGARARPGVGPSPGAGSAAVPGAGVAVHYSGAVREADDVIIDMVGHISYPRQVVVVSSDRRIAQAARRRRCGTLTAAKFLHRLALDRLRPAREIHPRPRGPLRADEVDEWIREFDLKDHELTAPPDPPRPPDPPAPTARPKRKPAPARSSTKKKGKRRRRTDSAARPGEVTEFPDDVLAEADDLSRDDGDEPSERGRGSERKKKGKSKRKSKDKKKRAVEPPVVREVIDEFPDDVLAEADDLTRDRDADEPTG